MIVNSPSWASSWIDLYVLKLVSTFVTSPLTWYAIHGVPWRFLWPRRRCISSGSWWKSFPASPSAVERTHFVKKDTRRILIYKPSYSSWWLSPATTSITWSLFLTISGRKGSSRRMLRIWWLETHIMLSNNRTGSWSTKGKILRYLCPILLFLFRWNN